MESVVESDTWSLSRRSSLALVSSSKVNSCGKKSTSHVSNHDESAHKQQQLTTITAQSFDLTSVPTAALGIHITMKYHHTESIFVILGLRMGFCSKALSWFGLVRH